jgi:hypothetical protein
MTEITIRNKELLGVLDETLEMFLEHKDLMQRITYEDGDLDRVTPFGDGKKWTEEESLRNHFLPNAHKHEGFPQQAMGFQVTQGCKSHPEIFEPLREHTKTHLPAFFGASNNSLTSYYPPLGYIGWHTNWNAYAYQLILTGSETGDGYFRHYDNKTDTVVTEEDVPGWQARWFRFGHYHEPEHHFWHAAWTECPRFTLAFKWPYGRQGTWNDLPDYVPGKLEQAQKAQQMFIDELELDID